MAVCSYGRFTAGCAFVIIRAERDRWGNADTTELSERTGKNNRQAGVCGARLAHAFAAQLLRALQQLLYGIPAAVFPDHCFLL